MYISLNFLVISRLVGTAGRLFASLWHNPSSVTARRITNARDAGLATSKCSPVEPSTTRSAIAPTFEQPGWIPEVSFTWWAMIGALVVFGVGVLFRTPERVRAGIARYAREAQTAEAVPLALRRSKGSTEDRAR